MNVTQVAGIVREYFLDHASRWKLSVDNLRVEYVPSLGGFGPMNFAVYDRNSSYHLKLSDEPDGLTAWVQASDRLASIYKAPRLLDQVVLAGRNGAIFERLPGRMAARSTPVDLLRAIVSMFEDLHRDGELGALLGGGARTARQTLLDYHLEMCDADLQEIESAVPIPFVGKDGAAWMRDQTEAIRQAAWSSAAFDEPVTSPIHGDLWFGNVLVDGDRWWIIDWDDLKIGDPAHDLSLILFAKLETGDAPSWLPDRDAAFRERFELYARAALLTFVVDPLADWIEPESYPEVREESRANREELHRWALARYKRIYGER